MSVYSTIHGAMVAPVTPDDTGTLAVAGTAETGNYVVASMIEVDDGLELTSYWKSPENMTDPVGKAHFKLTRVAVEAA